jgi:hypothetical protein
MMATDIFFMTILTAELAETAEIKTQKTWLKPKIKKRI